MVVRASAFEVQIQKTRGSAKEAETRLFVLKLIQSATHFPVDCLLKKKKCRIIVEWHTLSSHTTVKGFGFFDRRIFFNPTPSISTQTISGAIFLSSGIASGFFAPFHRPGSSIMETLVGSVVPGTSSIIRKTSCLLLFAGASL